MRRTVAWFLIRLAMRVMRWGVIIRPAPCGGVVLGVYVDPADQEPLSKACQRISEMGGYGGWVTMPESVHVGIVPPETIGIEPVTKEWLLSQGLGRTDLVRPETAPDEAFESGRIGVRFCRYDKVWKTYLLKADGFDGSEDFLAETNTRGEALRLWAALKYDPASGHRTAGG